MSELTGYNGCNDEPCALLRLGPSRLLLVHDPHGGQVKSRVIDLADLAKPKKDPGVAAMEEATASIVDVNLGNARIELRSVQRRQLYVDGKPVGEPIE